MQKYVSSGNKQQDIAHYQKLLIPLNIVVCVLCLVSIFTMMFVPFLKIDIGKIVSNDGVKAYIQEMITNGTDDNDTSDLGDELHIVLTESGSSSSEAAISDELMIKIVSSVINPILDELGKGDVSIKFSAFSALKVLAGGEDTFKEEITAIVNHLASGILDVAESLLKDGKIIDTIVNDSMPIIIDESINYLTSDDNDSLSPEAKQVLKDMTEEEKTKIKDSVKTLNEPCKDADAFIDKVGDIAPDLMLTFTGEKPTAEEIEDLKAELKDEINDKLAELTPEQQAQLDGNFKLETFICLMMSDSLSDLIGGGNSENEKTPSVSPVAYSPTAEEKTDEKKIYISFNDMYQDFQSEGDFDLKAEVEKAVDDALADVGDDLNIVSQMYGYVSLFFLFFILMWFILFLFSLIHIFRPNKRFVMWYVKLLCWIPGIIWLVLTIISMPSMVVTMVEMMGSEMSVELMTGVLSGISSWGTGISFICYIILWLVSIFWAFPIKHKIRKLRKMPDDQFIASSYGEAAYTDGALDLNSVPSADEYPDPYNSDTDNN